MEATESEEPRVSCEGKDTIQGVRCSCRRVVPYPTPFIKTNPLVCRVVIFEKSDDKFSWGAGSGGNGVGTTPLAIEVIRVCGTVRFGWGAPHIVFVDSAGEPDHRAVAQSFVYI